MLGQTGLLKLAVGALVATLAVAPGAAQQVQYVYDELGRLVELVSPDGSSVRYTYDGVGNIQSILKGAPATIAISEFTPNSGAAGSTLTIFGRGFSETAASNTVRINGTAATVSSATANRLIVTVPASATTGKVSVTSPNGTALSGSDFTVATLPAPTLLSFAPTVGAPGTALTITGTNFQVVKQDNKVTIGTAASTISTASATSLVATVPNAVSSGKVSVSTPFGRATSTTDFFALPDGILAADVIAMQRISINGASVTLNFPAAGKKALLIFDGSVNQFASLLATNSTLSSAYTKVYRPDGVLMATLSPGPSQPMSDLPRLPLVGTYMLVVEPNAVGAITLRLQGEKTGTLTVNGSTAITLAAGQDGRYTFSASADVGYGLAINPLTFTGSGEGTKRLDVELLRPDGSVGKLCNFYEGGSTNSCDFEPGLFPVSGTYTLRLSVAGLWANAFTAILSSDSGRAALTVNAATATTASIARAGQNASYTFSGTAGQNLSLALTGNSIVDSGVGGGNYTQVYVFAPSRAPIKSDDPPVFYVGVYGTQPTATLDLINLPETGTYVVRVLPSGLATGSIGIRLASDLTGALTLNGSTAISLASGRNGRYTFSAAANTGYGLALTGVSYTGTGDATQAIDAQLLDSSGAVLKSCGFSGDGKNSSCDFEPGLFVAAGTYTIRFDPRSTWAASFSAVLSTDAGRTALTANAASPTAVSIARPGQNATFTFSGTAGQNLSLALTGSTLDDADAATTNYTNVYVFAPSRTPVQWSSSPAYYSSLYTGVSSLRVDLNKLPETGTYVVRILPAALDTGNVNVRLVGEASGSLAVDGSTAVSLASGQRGRYSFSASANTGYGLALTGLTYTGVGESQQSVDAVLIDSRGMELKTCSFSGDARTSTCDFEPGLFSSAGTYTIRFDPRGTWTTAFNALFSTDAGRTVLAPNAATPTPVLIARAGQNATYTFSAVAGQNMKIALTGNTLDDADGATTNYTNIYVFAPSRTPVLVSSGPSYYGSLYTGIATTRVDLDNLPETGTYVVRVLPGGLDAGSLNIRIATEAVGALVVDGSTATSLTSGQSARLTFAASANTGYGLALSGLAYSGVGEANQGVDAHLLDSRSMTLKSCYFTGDAKGASCDFEPGLFAVSGTYAVRFEPRGTWASAFNAVLSADAGRTALVVNAATPTPISIARAGQNAAYTFSATAGQNLSLAITGNTLNDTDPATTNYTNVFVYPPSQTPVTPNRSYAYYNALPSGTTALTLPMDNLPETGVYLVRITPSGVDTGTLDIRITQTGTTTPAPQTVSGSVAIDGAATSASVVASGSGRYTFSGAAGQRLYLHVSDVATTPAGGNVYVTVTRPDNTSTLISCGTASVNSALMCALPVLPSTGTYTIRVEPGTYSATANLLLSNAVTGTLTPGAAPTTIRISRAGQGARYTFAATAGVGMSVHIGESTLGSYSTVEVLDPSGTQVSSGYAYGTQHSVVDVMPRATGEYVFLVRPAQASTGVVSVALRQDFVAGLNLDGAATPMNLAAGQSASYTFEGSAGQYVGLAATSLATSPSAASVSFRLISPQGVDLGSCNGYSGGAANCNYQRLPATGTYTIRVSIAGPYAATATITLSTDIQSSIAPNAATPTTVTITRQGQNARYSFSAAAGDGLSILTSNSTLGDYSYVYVVAPDGQIVSQPYIYATQSSGVDFVASQTGTYWLVVDGANGSTGQVELALRKDAVGTLIVDGASVPMALTQGQNGVYTFTGAVDQRLSLGITGFSTTPTASSAYITLRSPQGVELASCYFSSSSTCGFGTLNAAGTYTLRVDPSGVLGATGNLTLSTDQAGTLTANAATPTAVTVSRPGQRVRLSFTAPANTAMTLLLSDSTFAGSSPVTILDPDGVAFATAYAYAGQVTGTEFMTRRSGSYTALLSLQEASTGSMKLALAQESTGTLTLGAAPTALSLSNGQKARLSFAGTAGTYVELALTEFATLPVDSYVNAKVYSPQGVEIATCSSPTPKTCLLPKLFSTGTYVVRIGLGLGVTGNLKVGVAQR
ncbi:hypothetical protein IP84_13985 [beta proteobacterium AAP99]|nr:hypothetical protein IP84_13985 [beta proteobacterium AAP99]